MSATFILSPELRAQLAAEARRALPRECCGLIEGVRVEDGVRATALHATPNLAGEPDRFEIDPAVHICLLRALRGTGREIVGCYHSHPNGRAEPSARDRAGEKDFLWLIAAPGTAGDVALGAFVHDGTGFVPVALA